MLVYALMNTEGTMLRRALTGDDWTRTDHLLALVFDALAAGNWQRGGGKGRRPKRISPLAKRPTAYGAPTGRTNDEVKAYLARFGPPPS